MRTKEFEITRQSRRAPPDDQVPELVTRRITRAAASVPSWKPIKGEDLFPSNGTKQARTAITISISNDSIVDVLAFIMKHIRIDKIEEL